MEFHPMEREWRRFRSSGKGELLRKSFGLIPKYLREMGLALAQISPEVVLPAAIPYGLLKAEEVMRRGVQLLSGLSTRKMTCSRTVFMSGQHIANQKPYIG